MNQNVDRNHFAIVDSLRGIAALMVVAFHASTGLNKSLLVDIAAFGKHGVIIFFVISGFIIPYSLHRSGQTIQNMPNFLWRRILRLNPPYYGVLFLTILFYLGVKVVSPHADAEHLNITGSRIFFHLTYLIPFVGENWYSVVFWTLAIEFEYYVLIAVFYPFLMGKKYWLLLGMIILSFSHYLPFAKTYVTIVSYSTFFMIGIIIFLYKISKINSRQMLISSVILFLLCKFQSSGTEMLFAIFTYLSIMFIKFSIPILDYVGKISYSLYLTHSLFMSVFIALISKIFDFNHILFGKEILCFLLFTLCLPVAYIYYISIEKASIVMAQKFKPVKA